MRLVLCDSNRIFGESLASMLREHGHRVLAVTTDAADGVAAVTANRPDACLLDLRSPDGGVLDVARTIRRSVPDTKVVVFSSVAEPAVVSEAKKIGVAGFLRKDQKTGTIMRALEVISAGKLAFDLGSPRQPSRRTLPSATGDLLRKLTPRERQVLQRMVAGQSTGQMAREMNVAMSTVRSHIGRVLIKLDAHSQIQAAAIASRWGTGDGSAGILEPPGRVAAGR